MAETHLQVIAPPEKLNLTAPVGTLMRPTARVNAEDTLERAAAEMRRNGAGMVPVVDEDILQGIITDTSLALAMAEGTPLVSPATIATVVGETIAPYATGAEALRRLAEGDGRPLVVVDDMRRVLGLIGSVDLFPFHRPLPRPTAAGGMATPFGVYLTTGAVRAGVKWWALMATGATLMALIELANLLGAGVATWAHHFGLPESREILLAEFLTFGFFMLGMRLLPLAGTHAAEHMVVHAIERGEPLVPEVVARMPRIHPRCGTNLAAGSAIFLGIMSQPWPEDTQLRLILAAASMWVFWRPVGSILQQYVTTKPPSAKQIAGGIRSGEALLHEYATSKIVVPSIPLRLWNSGLGLVMAGSLTCAVAMELIGKLFGAELGLKLW